jgi:hypothetical protein
MTSVKMYQELNEELGVIYDEVLNLRLDQHIFLLGSAGYYSCKPIHIRFQRILFMDEPSLCGVHVGCDSSAS